MPNIPNRRLKPVSTSAISVVRKASAMATSRLDTMPRTSSLLSMCKILFSRGLKPLATLAISDIAGSLSHDLYQTTTHFLLELIQNADDNSYSKDVTPTLSISHSPGRIRIDCNERGFAKKNIEAICRICKSTKSGRSKSAGFVGEKGIGFKAVFKVASMVWISSGHYSFRFNRDGHLGMIAPIWDTFPDHKHPQGGTSIILELASQCDEPSIIHELSKYDSKVLMFLRRLRRIEISVKQQFWKIGGDFKTTLSRVDKDPRPADRAQMVMLYKNGKKTNYLVWRHMVDKMPPDERRPGITDSEIVLAFPLTASEEPLIETQDVYAFLPVKSIGLNFLVQGDFLLTANREAFHIESSWNKTLVGATISAFVDAVGYMSHLDSNLRYTWLRFVPRDTNPNHSIWNHLQSDITRRLVTTEILETQDGQFRKPANLVYVPNAYRDRTGRPLINYDDRHDMSKKYNIESDPSLFITLGVSYLSISTFQKSVVKHLDGHFSHKRFYKDKDQEWHHDFCKALNTLPKNFWAYESPKLYIIPLSNGKWARPTDGFLFLRPPSKEGILPVPEGLKVRIVDEEAMKDSFRRATCENANIKYLNNDEIRNLILNGHNTEVKGPKNFDPTALAAKALVSHAVFLFNINSTSASTGKIYMAGDMGDCRRGKNMYFQSDLSGSARKVLVPGPQKTYGFLHSSYQNAVERERYGEWFEFLSSQLSVATFPRIWSVDEQDEYTLDTRKKKIHKDFAGLLKSQATIEWLVILRDGWEESTKNPQRPNTQGTYNHSISTFGEHFRSFPVPRKGRLAPIKLGEGFQPTPRLVKKYGTLAPLIELPDPNHRNWGPLLDALGIPDKETAGFYAECLRSARDAVDQVPMDMIRELMSGMDVIKGQDNPPANRRTMSRVDVERIARTKGTTFFQ